MVEQNLAHALAREHRVLYVEPALSPVTPFRHGFSATTMRGLRGVADRRVRSVGRLHVFRPLALPPVEHPRARSLSVPLLRSQVRHAVRRCGMTQPVVVAARSLIDLAGAAGESLSIFMVMDWMDAGAAALLGLDPRALIAENEAMCAAADVICATSATLRDSLANRGWHSELLSHGFAADLADRYDRADQPPPEYEGLPRPVLGYTGTIDDKLDFDVIAALARRFDRGSIVLVGPVSPRLSERARHALASEPNIHMLGLKGRDDLPAYVRHLDCALIPLRDTEWARHCSPLKLWEYLYAGPPIVGLVSHALRDRSPSLVHFAQTPDRMGEAVATALRTGQAGREQRRAYALANSWDTRASQLDEIVRGVLQRRQVLPPGSVCVANGMES